MVGTIQTEGVKNSTGSGKAKELICMTHGHELKVGGNAGERENAGERGIKGRKNCNKCNQ